MLPFTLQQLRILKAIATEKNFTKAGQFLYISQPALSKQIKILEKNLDTLVINRDRKKISLTQSGKTLLQYSERVLILCEESCRALIDLKNSDRGNLTLGASQSVGTYLMPKILTIFTCKYPQINLKVQIHSTQQIIKRIIKHEINLAIVEGEISNEFQKKIIINPFIYDELNLIIAKSHPLAEKSTIDKEDLYCLNFVSLTSNSTVKKSIDNTLIQNQIEIKQLKTILQLNSIEGIKTAVSLGLGVAFLFSTTIEKELKFQMIKIIKIKNIKIIRKVFIISNYDSYKSTSFNTFYNELKRFKTKLKSY